MFNKIDLTVFRKDVKSDCSFFNEDIEGLVGEMKTASRRASRPGRGPGEYR